MKFPYHKQNTDYTCGPASLRMVLECFGIKKSEKELVKALKTTKSRGTKPQQFQLAVEQTDLDYVVGTKANVFYLKKLLTEKFIFIVLYFYPPEQCHHYSVVKKIDSKFIYFWNPDDDFGPVSKYKIKDFETLWNKTSTNFRKPGWFVGIRK